MNELTTDYIYIITKNCINKYKNIETIGVEYEYNNRGYKDIIFQLYDYLNKGTDFISDIKSIENELKADDRLGMFNINIIKDFIHDTYWNGEEMVKSNLSCDLTIKRVRR